MVQLISSTPSYIHNMERTTKQSGGNKLTRVSNVALMSIYLFTIMRKSECTEYPSKYHLHSFSQVSTDLLTNSNSLLLHSELS